VCISWTNKGLDTMNMRGATMKIIFDMSILQTSTTTTAKLLISESPCRETRAEGRQYEGHCTQTERPVQPLSYLTCKLDVSTPGHNLINLAMPRR